MIPTFAVHNSSQNPKKVASIPFILFIAKKSLTMPHANLKVLLSISIVFIFALTGLGQKVKNVPKAFKALSSEPEIFLIENEIAIPTEGGHLQGVQLIIIDGQDKLLISGSSRTEAYILQTDLLTQKTEELITLMSDPFRHAGGFQVSEPYLAVGIEDNYTKTVSKVSLYNYKKENFQEAEPNFVIERVGEPKAKTAGSVGILETNGKYLLVVGNWDSRNWDFYIFDPEKEDSQLLETFTAPDQWPSYQAINLIKDKKAIYAIGFYQKEDKGHADLIFVSKNKSIKPQMKLLLTKTFNVSNLVDFHTAAGLQVDNEGKLHIWATQRDALKQITVNRFSEN